jgi:hypothetical protein
MFCYVIFWPKKENRLGLDPFHKFWLIIKFYISKYCLKLINRKHVKSHFSYFIDMLYLISGLNLIDFAIKIFPFLISFEFF